MQVVPIRSVAIAISIAFPTGNVHTCTDASPSSASKSVPVTRWNRSISRPATRVRISSLSRYISRTLLSYWVAHWGNLASVRHLSSWDWICSRGTMELWAPLGQVVGGRNGAQWGISAPSGTAERRKLSVHSGSVNTIQIRDCLIFASLRRILRL